MNKIKILNSQEVRQLLPMQECIEVMSEGLMQLARGQAQVPLRSVMVLPEKIGALGMMPGFINNPPLTGLKVVTVFPGNHGSNLDSHQGAVLLFDGKNGQPLALLDASSITAIRTAAVSGVATRLLARSGIREASILGAGVQGSSHFVAMTCVAPLDRIRIWSRSIESTRRFIENHSGRGPALVACPTAEEAVQGSPLICTTTAAPTPILSGAWLAPGCHVNAVGSSVKFTRELDTEAVVRSRLFVDRRESTLNEAGDFLMPKQEGAITDEHIVAELGEILIGTDEGRRNDEEITLFKSLGLAVEDLCSAQHVYRKALEQGVGTDVALGGLRETS